MSKTSANGHAFRLNSLLELTRRLGSRVQKQTRSDERTPNERPSRPRARRAAASWCQGCHTKGHGGPAFSVSCIDYRLRKRRMVAQATQKQSMARPPSSSPQTRQSSHLVAKLHSTTAEPSSRARKGWNVTNDGNVESFTISVEGQTTDWTYERKCV